jgi:hypothetical protein
MIVVSIDPDTDQVAMPPPRDTVDVPSRRDPPGTSGATYWARSAVGPRCNHPSWFPPITVDGKTIDNGPGYSGLKAILGNPIS